MISLFLKKQPPPTRFLILFPGRTGSTYLISCLQAHSQVIAEFEKLCDKTSEQQQAFVREFYDTPRHRRIRAVGFKTKPKTIRDHDGFAAMMRERGIRINQLRRRNLVKAAVSTINARRLFDLTGEWNRSNTIKEVGPLLVPPEKLVEMIDLCAHDRAEVKRYVDFLKLPTITLDYEDLLADRKAFFAQIAGFLEIGRITLRGAFEKNTNDDLRHALVNYDEIHSHFSGTVFEEDFSQAGTCGQGD